jgi:hypothetical protein
MGYESYLRKRQISISNRCYKPTGKHRHSFSFSVFIYRFSLVYRSAFAHIFPRSQPMRESNPFFFYDSDYVSSAEVFVELLCVVHFFGPSDDVARVLEFTDRCRSSCAVQPVRFVQMLLHLVHYSFDYFLDMLACRFGNVPPEVSGL